MNNDVFRHVYGPVPSRRLGRSLGLDLVPFKTCTYDCIYCQLGRTTDKTVLRKEYIPHDEIFKELERKLAQKDRPDYISLAGSGEPTLYKDLGLLIDGIKRLTDIPIAMITNGSLLWMREIREELAKADIVLPSLDAGDERLFRYVNHPHDSIDFDTMIEGIAGFTAGFKGEVWLEILLLADITGVPVEMKKIADITARISPARVQLNTVVRPPADNKALPVSTEQMNSFKCFFNRPVEIISDKPSRTPQSGAVPDSGEEAVLAMLNRRPCTSADIVQGLSVNLMHILKHIDSLLARDKIKTVMSGGRTYYSTRKENPDT